MKYFLVNILAVIFLSACNKAGKQVKEKIANADSVAINYFRGDGTMDTVVAVTIVKDKKVIEDLTGFVSNCSGGKKNKCGYDGSIHFFKMNQVVQDVDFRMGEDECSQFSFSFLGEYYVAVLSRDAGKLLSELKQKK